MRHKTTTLPVPPARPFPVADRDRDGHLYETEHPRLAAIRHLRELLADHRAGLDPDDMTVLILDVLPHERVWARSVVELTGLYLSEIPSDGMGCRFRMIVEADVRHELGLDEPGAPRMGDRPQLRLVEDPRSAEALALEAGFRLLEQPETDVMRALADARAAQQRYLERSVH